MRPKSARRTQRTDHSGATGGGGQAPYTITDPNTGEVQSVLWNAPALNTVLYRYDESELKFILVYGRPFSPMSPWGLAGGGPMNDQQIDTLIANCAEFGIELFHFDDPRNGIVHIIGPEQGFTLPGVTLVCGDSHTATHGAFGALAFGIGTSEVEHVLATQTLIQRKAKNMRITVDGKLPDGVTAKDIILSIIGQIGTAGGTGHVIEYAGEAIRALSMEGRMTVCNMSIEGGARAGMIAPDAKTFAYLEGRPKAPKGAAWDKAMQYWETLRSDDGAEIDTVLRDAEDRVIVEIRDPAVAPAAFLQPQDPDPSDGTRRPALAVRSAALACQAGASRHPVHRAARVERLRRRVPRDGAPPLRARGATRRCPRAPVRRPRWRDGACDRRRSCRRPAGPRRDRGDRAQRRVRRAGPCPARRLSTAEHG